MWNETPKSCEWDFIVQNWDLELKDTDKRIKCENDRAKVEQLRRDNAILEEAERDRADGIILKYPDSEKWWKNIPDSQKDTWPKLPDLQKDTWTKLPDSKE